MADVRRASSAEWRALKEARLRALADSPSAFSSTLAREAAYPDEEWQRRAGRGNTFLAWAGERVVGVTAMVTAGDRPNDAELVGMWVEPGRRGTGVAAALVEAILDAARAAGAGAVDVWVADGNARARRLYERRGFRATGERLPFPSAPRIDQERLRLPLSA